MNSKIRYTLNSDNDSDSTTSTSATAGTCYVNSQLSSLSTSGGSISTVSTGSLSLGYGTVYYDATSEATKCTLFEMMTEKEIEEILDKIISRSKENEKIMQIVVLAVRSRHYSEAFLSKYLEWLSIYDIKENHSAELSSGEYSSVALYYELLK